eukprot:g16862.t1
MPQLENKSAVILGAAKAGNMAQAIAERLADEGAKVMVSGRNEEELAAFAEKIGGSYATCDITDHAQVKELAEKAQAEFGSVDIALNATGWGLGKPVTDVEDDELDTMVAIQFKGVHYFLAEFVRAMMANPVSDVYLEESPMAPGVTKVKTERFWSKEEHDLEVMNQVAKFRYMFGGKSKCPLVIRCNMGAGYSAAAQHSQTVYQMMTAIPGLKVVVPSNAYDAKGLLISAIRDDDPVLFFEHKLIYQSKCEVPDEAYTIPFGEAEMPREEMENGTVTEWHSSLGDNVTQGDELVDLESDKIVNTLEATASGVLRRVFADVDDTMEVGELMGVIADADVSDDAIDEFVAKFNAARGEEGEADSADAAPVTAQAQEPTAAAAETEAPGAVAPAPAADSNSGEVRVSPPINYDDYVDVICNSGVKIVETAGRSPEPFMERFNAYGIKVIHNLAPLASFSACVVHLGLSRFCEGGLWTLARRDLG